MVVHIIEQEAFGTQQIESNTNRSELGPILIVNEDHAGFTLLAGVVFPALTDWLLPIAFERFESPTETICSYS